MLGKVNTYRLIWLIICSLAISSSRFWNKETGSDSSAMCCSSCKVGLLLKAGCCPSSAVVFGAVRVQQVPSTSWRSARRGVEFRRSVNCWCWSCKASQRATVTSENSQTSASADTKKSREVSVGEGSFALLESSRNHRRRYVRLWRMETDRWAPSKTAEKQQYTRHAYNNQSTHTPKRTGHTNAEESRMAYSEHAYHLTPDAILVPRTQWQVRIKNPRKFVIDRD